MSYQAALINELEADQDVAVKAVIAGTPVKAWQEPEQGCGYHVAEAVHIRLIIHRLIAIQERLAHL